MYVFLQQLKLATSNLVHNSRLGLAYQKTMFKGKGLDTCYSATYMSLTRDQQRFTISEVAADRHEPLMPQRIVAWVWARGASKNILDVPLAKTIEHSNPLKLATLNLVHNLGLGLAYPEMTFKTKIGGGLGQAKKIPDPLLISATVEASNFKNLVHNLGFRLTQSVSRTLDRPRVVAPSKTCDHLRSSRRRWR